MIITAFVPVSLPKLEGHFHGAGDVSSHLLSFPTFSCAAPCLAARCGRCLLRSRGCRPLRRSNGPASAAKLEPSSVPCLHMLAFCCDTCHGGISPPPSVLHQFPWLARVHSASTDFFLHTATPMSTCSFACWETVRLLSVDFAFPTAVCFSWLFCFASHRCAWCYVGLRGWHRDHPLHHSASKPFPFLQLEYPCFIS